MAHSRLYVKIMNSKEWREARGSYLSDHPLCEACQAEGYVQLAQCVHHKTEVESGKTERECWQLATSSSNLQALCYRHHREAHRELRSHSKEQHQKREQERLSQWLSRLKGGGSNPGGLD